jgi:hypothetical protein
MSTLEDRLSGLIHLEGFPFPTYYSAGAKGRAERLSTIASNCLHFIKEFYKTDIPIKLLVLNEVDYYERYPEGSYGLIHGFDDLLWYPTYEEDNPVYADMVPYYENGPSHLKQKLGELLPDSESPFLTACLMWWETYMVHEMFHNYSKADGVRIQLRWFDELFGDYINYAFLKRYHEQYKTELHVAEVYFEILYIGGHSIVKHSSIEDFERLYTGVGNANYCWYHGWFNVGVFDLYEMYGEDFIEKVNNLFKSDTGFDSSSETLVARLGNELDGFLDWYEEWIKQNP